MKTLLLLIVVVLLAGCGDPNYDGTPSNKNYDVISCTPGEIVKNNYGNKGVCPVSGYIILTIDYLPPHD